MQPSKLCAFEGAYHPMARANFGQATSLRRGQVFPVSSFTSLVPARLSVIVAADITTYETSIE